METAEKKPPEDECIKRVIEKAFPPFARECHSCGRKTVDVHETICIECGAGTRKYERG
jgi:hypothetical protein